MLLDTNALFFPVRSRFPLEAEIGRLVPGARIVVPQAVLDELDRLVERAEPDAGPARLLADRFEKVASTASGDEAIVRTAIRLRATVVTADRDLASRLRHAGAAVLAPRDRHRLELRGPLRGARRGNG